MKLLLILLYIATTGNCIVKAKFVSFFYLFLLKDHAGEPVDTPNRNEEAA